MILTAKDRIAEIKGRPDTVWIKQKARNNSRVILVNLNTGQTTGESFLVASDQLVNIRNYQPANKIQPTLRPQHRIAEIKGRTDTVLIKQKARNNSRVILVDLKTGQTTGETFLVPSDQLVNIRNYQATAETSSTIRIPTRLLDRLVKLAKPAETSAEVIERLLPPEDTGA